MTKASFYLSLLLVFIGLNQGFTQLSGSYTIDSSSTTSGTNYQSFSAAISALSTNGVSAAVHFSVLKGTYSAQISIPGITGASTSNTITFKGLGDLTKITATPTTGNRPVVSFNGPSHIVFDSLQVRTFGTQGWAVHFMNHTDSVVIQNCHIIAPVQSTSFAVIAASNKTSTSITSNEAEYITLRNNVIEGGNAGVSIIGMTGPLTTPSRKVNYGTNLLIEGNVIKDFRSKGLDLSNNHKVDLIGNTISSSETNVDNALRYWDAGDSSRIIGNSFYVKSNIINTRVVALSMAPANGPAGDSTQPIIIANNFIQYEGTNSTTPTGLLLKNKAYIKVNNNTIKIKNQGANANCIWFDANNTRALDGIEIRNNVMALDNGSTGQFFFGAANGAVFKSMVIDHNNYFAPSSYFRSRIPNGTSGVTNYSSFANYQSNSVGYGSGSMNTDPLFLHKRNLHATSSIMNDSGAVISIISDDIDGDVRSSSNPDIGADEYTPGQIVCPGPVVVLNECPGFSITVGSNTYTTSGTYTDTLSGSRGCDSVVVSIISVGTNSSAIDTVVACGSYTWINGVTYTTNNTTAVDTIPNASGCDSVVSLNLTMLQNSSATDTIVACGFYTWIDGRTYTTNNSSAQHTIPNAVGCDSLVTLNFTIGTNSGLAVLSGCDSLTWINGVTYTSSNYTDWDTLTNALMCDSFVTLNLTMNYSDFSSDSIEACGMYTWIDGNTYTSDNSTAMFTTTTSAGCDSIISLSLDIKDILFETDSHAACDSFLWINGETYTASNFTATDTLTSLNGCDSIVTLSLSITTIDSNVSHSGDSISALSAGASYQWIDCSTNQPIPGATSQTFVADSDGEYAVVLMLSNCTDTSECIEITGVGVEEFSDERMKLFPNPNNGNFEVYIPKYAGNASLEVMNAQGQLVFHSKNVTAGTMLMNLHLSKGVYLLRLKSMEGVQTLSFILD